MLGCLGSTLGGTLVGGRQVGRSAFGWEKGDGYCGRVAGRVVGRVVGRFAGWDGRVFGTCVVVRGRVPDGRCVFGILCEGAL